MRDHAFITGHLALPAEPPLHPRQRGIQRKQNQAQLLNQVAPVVAAAQVFGLMQNNLFQLAEGQPSPEPLWNQDSRLEKTDHTRPIERA